MTKQQTNILKGVVILMMLFYHLFNRDDITNVCTPLLYIGNIPLVHYMSKACYPVIFFTILSGYGLSYVYRHKKLYFKNQLKRISKLYIYYWIVLAIFVPIGCYIDSNRYPNDWLHFINNITGFHCTYNGETWFLLPYALISLSSVFIIPYLFSLKTIKSWIIAVLGYSVVFGIIKLLPLDDDLPFINLIMQFVYYVVLLFYFVAGVLFYRYFENKSINTTTIGNSKVILLLLILFSIKSLFKITLADTFYAIIFIFLFIQLSLPVAISKALESLGQHSMPMWMTHTFFAIYLFQDFIYGFKYPILIYLVLVIISYIVSFPILYIGKKVNNKIFNNFSSSPTSAQ